MKFATTSVKTGIGAAAIAAASIFTAVPAIAAPPPNIQGFGTSQQLVDGSLVTTYTVSNLQPSNIAIPGYTPEGTLYQADITARSESGLVTPMVKNFTARGPNGQTYEMVDDVAVPNGLNPAPIPQGNESTGKLYFDVTGAPPNGVVYNDGLQDILIWTSNVPQVAGPGVPPNSVSGGPASPGTGAPANSVPGMPASPSPAPGALPGPATS
ncbi:Immunogenic protein MPT63 [Mycobacterium shimoidei]|uniref:Immunogenic protein MPT63 n=1 Tax=Mycobacterium shimoidei TaxID=29313 RepID=A0A375Z2C2_MYCSH|nr:MPT63 family protein [Mycobacterium shimoidei]SRX95279.1 Immunogenic protein MPT63 [Mycobacterium shimoidei]